MALLTYSYLTACIMFMLHFWHSVSQQFKVSLVGQQPVSLNDHWNMTLKHHLCKITRKWKSVQLSTFLSFRPVSSFYDTSIFQRPRLEPPLRASVYRSLSTSGWFCSLSYSHNAGKQTPVSVQLRTVWSEECMCHAFRKFLTFPIKLFWYVGYSEGVERSCLCKHFGMIPLRPQACEDNFQPSKR